MADLLCLFSYETPDPDLKASVLFFRRAAKDARPRVRIIAREVVASARDQLGSFQPPVDHLHGPAVFHPDGLEQSGRVDAAVAHQASGEAELVARAECRKQVAGLEVIA
jgi:hypothetical protein